MAPIDTKPPSHDAYDMETTMKWSEPQKDGVKNHGVVDATLRAVLSATTNVALIAMVTSKETKMIPISPTMKVPLDASFNQSPAYIYYVSAITVACLYSIITCMSSVLALMKKGGINIMKLQFYLEILDSLFFGIVASATGAAAAVGYIAIKGNSHSRWNKFCNIYRSFCHQMEVSVFMSLISTLALLLLVCHSFYRNKIARK
ncbi:CASP-like protein 1 [Tanacetum coccineum]